MKYTLIYFEVFLGNKKHNGKQAKNLLLLFS